MEKQNQNKAKKSLIYSVLSRILKWISIGLGVAGLIAGITVGILSGFVNGLVTLFGCFLFGVASYASSSLFETQALALAAELKPHQEPTKEINEKNTLHMNVQENTNTNEFYTVDIKNTSIEKTPHIERKKVKSTDSTEYYTVSNGNEEKEKYNTETLEK